MLASVRPPIVLVFIFTALCGLAYPLVVTGIAQLVLPRQANGSLIVRNGSVVGSSLIGQSWTDPKHFWGRASATSPAPYNASASSGSNLGPTNPALIDAVKQRAAAFSEADVAAGVTRAPNAAIPIDLVTSSASGLDPDISPAAALWQVARVAAARKLDEAALRAFVEGRIVQRTAGVWGEPRINVLELNLALDAFVANNGGQP